MGCCHNYIQVLRQVGMTLQLLTLVHQVIAYFLSVHGLSLCGQLV